MSKRLQFSSTILFLLLLLFGAAPGHASTSHQVFETETHDDYDICVIFGPAVELGNATLRFDGIDDKLSLQLSIVGKREWKLLLSEGKKQSQVGAGEFDVKTDLLVKCRGKSLRLYNGPELIMARSLPRALLGNWWMDEALQRSAPDTYGQRVGDIHFEDGFAREEGASDIWESESDAFSVTLVPNPGAAMNAFWYRASSSTRAVSLAGYDMWDAYRYRAAIKRVSADGECGVIVGASECHRGWALISRGPKVVLTSLEAPGIVLAEAPCLLRPGQWYMTETQYSDTHLRFLVDGTLILEKAISSRGGRIGLLVDGATALFDDVSVVSLSPGAPSPESKEEIPEFFKEDPYMRKWTAKLQSQTDQHVQEFFFQRQPVDWIPLQGVWQLFSRWSCKPKWPFFGAPAQEGSVICYKRPIQGDFTIDLFATSPMFARRSPGYNYPLNLQVMVHTKDAQPGTGYRFVYGSYDIPSVIEANGVCLATSARLVKTDLRHGFGGPRSMNQLVHRLWPHITVSRRDGILSMRFNDSPLLSVEDPVSLEGGLLTISAWRNGVSIARIRIAADAIEDSVGPQSNIYAYQFPANALKQGLDLTNVEPIADIAPAPVAIGTLASDERSWRSDFSEGVPPWLTVQGAEGATPRLKKEGADSFVRLVNTRFGGSMAVSLWRGSVPLSANPRLRFRYRIPVWMKLNIRCQLDNNRWVEIPFLDKNQSTFLKRGRVRGTHSVTEWQEVDVLLQKQLWGFSGNLRQIVLADGDHCSSYLGSFYDLKSVELSAEGALKLDDPREHKPATPFDIVKYGDILSFENCEGEMPAITSRDGLSFMPRERSTGGHALWLFPNGKEYYKPSVCIFNQSYKPADFPSFSFDYRGSRSSVMLQAVVGQQEVVLTDLQLQPDNRWHRASLNINDLLARALPDADEPSIDALLMTLVYGRPDLEVDNLIISE